MYLYEWMNAWMKQIDTGRLRTTEFFWITDGFNQSQLPYVVDMSVGHVTRVRIASLLNRTCGILYSVQGGTLFCWSANHRPLNWHRFKSGSGTKFEMVIQLNEYYISLHYPESLSIITWVPQQKKMILFSAKPLLKSRKIDYFWRSVQGSFLKLGDWFE